MLYTANRSGRGIGLFFGWTRYLDLEVEASGYADTDAELPRLGAPGVADSYGTEELLSPPVWPVPGIASGFAGTDAGLLVSVVLPAIETLGYGATDADLIVLLTGEAEGYGATEFGSVAALSATSEAEGYGATESLAGVYALGEARGYGSDLASALLVLLAPQGEAIGYGVTLSPPKDWRVLVVNVDTGAMSLYQLPVQVSGLATFGGKVYVSSPDGLYSLDGSTDDGEPIQWSVRTGFSNWGSDVLKNMCDIDVQARWSGAASLTVTTDRLGVKARHTYNAPPIVRDSYIGSVIKVGRGLESVYWGFELSGDGDAEIDEIRLPFFEKSRRR